MKRILGAVLALMLSVANFVDTAKAQDDWNSLYFGGNLGYGSASNDHAWGDPVPPVEGPIPYSTSGDGFVGGGQVGLQRQWNNVVVGAEVSFTKLAIDDAVGPARSPPLDSRVIHTSELEWVSAATVKLGYAMPQGLVYVKGGLAWAKGKQTTFVNAPASEFAAGSQDLDGWTVGVGVASMLFPQWNASLGIEYNYYRLEGDTVDLASNRGNAQTDTFDSDLHTVAARLNFHLQLH